METGVKFKAPLQVLSAVVLLGVGIFLGKNSGSFFTSPSIVPNNLSAAIRQGQGKYTNPLLECDQTQVEFVELKPFKDQISKEVSALGQDPDISLISVYFRDMNNGPWFGINSAATFAPASLLKVPLAIAYYKLNEQSPGYIQKTIVYNGPSSSWPDIAQTIPPKQSLVAGQSYTIEELIRRMLAYSDNQAYYLLFSNINFEDLQKVYDDFGLKLKDPGSTDGSTVTVKGYSGFFRILFNSSYLGQADSEKVLAFLADSDFTGGLAGGVPPKTAVAHKFGEREISGSAVDQIHDCGIIYYPYHPYLLCVMTQGYDVNKQINAIRQLSSDVYSQVSAQN